MFKGRVLRSFGDPYINMEVWPVLYELGPTLSLLTYFLPIAGLFPDCVYSHLRPFWSPVPEKPLTKPLAKAKQISSLLTFRYS